MRQNNDFKLVAVSGSVGKTSTKLAIAKTLSATKKVIYQDGNYNDRLTVPLILFGHIEPGIYNVLAWFKILRANKRQLSQRYPYDVAVVELGTDAPGQLRKFGYLRPDVTVITAVADEHMSQFKTLEAVAKEEMVPVEFSRQVLLNIDDVAGQYRPKSAFSSYSLSKGADYYIGSKTARSLQGLRLSFRLPGGKRLDTEVAVLGEQGAKIALAAVAVGDLLGIAEEGINKGLKAVTPVAGRMQILAGKQGSLIIDDTYNASPVAVKAALDVLYDSDAKRRIAILGSMNELGADSPKMHREIGGYCDPKKLDLVVTVGREAAKYISPAAEKQGCIVKSFVSPYEAGEHVVQQLQTGVVVLAKGSQDGVFAEEAIKPLLANPAQARKLVRQSSYWLKRKKQQFPANT